MICATCAARHSNHGHCHNCCERPLVIPEKFAEELPHELIVKIYDVYNNQNGQVVWFSFSDQLTLFPPYQLHFPFQELDSTLPKKVYNLSPVVVQKPEVVRDLIDYFDEEDLRQTNTSKMPTHYPNPLY